MADDNFWAAMAGAAATIALGGTFLSGALVGLAKIERDNAEAIERDNAEAHWRGSGTGPGATGGDGVDGTGKRHGWTWLAVLVTSTIVWAGVGWVLFHSLWHLSPDGALWPLFVLCLGYLALAVVAIIASVAEIDVVIRTVRSRTVGFRLPGLAAGYSTRQPRLDPRGKRRHRSKD